MNRFTILLLSIAGIILPVEAFSSSLEAASTASRTQRQLTIISSARRITTSPLGFVKPHASSSRLLFSPTETNEGKEEPWIRPAVHNSPMFRAFAILYALLFAIYQSSNAPSATGATALEKIGKHIMLAPKAAATLHVLSFGTWFGTVVYTTFIAGITMFKVR
jgi:hypothetical protein